MMIEKSINCLGIIPARGGSKGIKSKNMVLLNGQPLISYTINTARQAKICNDIIIATDCSEIRDYCVERGITSLGLLDEYFTHDNASVVYTVKSEIEKYEKKFNVKVHDILLLQPTAPLRLAEDIKKAYDIFKDTGAESLISCIDGTFAHPRTMYKKHNGCLTPYLEVGKKLIHRQDMEQVYLRNGAIYLTKKDYFVSNESFVSDYPALYEMPHDRSANIDSPIDLAWAEFLIQQQNQNHD